MKTKDATSKLSHSSTLFQSAGTTKPQEGAICNITDGNISTDKSKTNFSETNNVTSTFLLRKFEAEKDFVIEEVKNGMYAWTEILANELGIDINKLKPLLPQVIDIEKFARLWAGEISIQLMDFPPEVCRASIKSIPFEVASELSEELLKHAFNESESMPEFSNVSICDVFEGGYFSQWHLIIVNNKLRRNDDVSLKSVGAHEGNHAINALFRSLLSEGGLIDCLAEALEIEIISGAVSIYSIFDVVQELPYVPSQNMRTKVAQFLSSLINNIKIEANDNRLTTESYIIGNKTFLINRLSDTGKDDLLKIASDFDDFLSLFECKDDALIALTNLIEVQLSRLKAALGQFPTVNSLRGTIKKDEFEKLSANARQELLLEFRSSIEVRKFAHNSATNFLELFDGNAKFVIKQFLGADSTFSEVNDYLFCPEEVQSHIAGIIVELMDPDISIEKKEKLEAMRNFHIFGKEYMRYTKQLRIAKQDIDLVRQENKHRVVRIKLNDTLDKITKIVREHLSQISNAELNACVEQYLESNSKISVIFHRLDITKLKSLEHEQLWRELDRLRVIRCKIKTLLINGNHKSKEIEKFIELTENESKVYETYRLLQGELDERCLNPESRITDKEILEKLNAAKRKAHSFFK